VVEEYERANHAPRAKRQNTPHLEPAAKVMCTLVDDAFYGHWLFLRVYEAEASR
jgi:hypothetical protein